MTVLMDKLERCDPTIFDPIPAQLSVGDKKSLLALAAALRARGTPYTYLEIGSYWGGSLQPFLVDPLCKKIYSIDSHPIEQPKDERKKIKWTPVTTADMLDKLRPIYGEFLGKLETIDSDTASIDKSRVSTPPNLCFIDGEHTDKVSYDDFVFCQSVADAKCAFLFHDTQVVFKGIKRCVSSTNNKSAFYFVPGKMAVIETGTPPLITNETLLARLTQANEEGFESLEQLAFYRNWYMESRAAKMGRTIADLYRRFIYARKTR